MLNTLGLGITLAVAIIVFIASALFAVGAYGKWKKLYRTKKVETEIKKLKAYAVKYNLKDRDKDAEEDRDFFSINTIVREGIVKPTSLVYIALEKKGIMGFLSEVDEGYKNSSVAFLVEREIDEVLEFIVMYEGKEHKKPDVKTIAEECKFESDSLVYRNLKQLGVGNFVDQVKEHKNECILTLAEKGRKNAFIASLADEGCKKSFKNSFNKWIPAIAATAFILFVPVYWTYFAREDVVLRGLKTFLMCIHNVMRIFILDGDFEPIHEIFVNAQVTGNKALFLTVKWIYTAGAAALYVAAPVLTAGFVLSLFKGIWQNFLYQCWRRADEVYIISELNERSIELAKDIVNEDRIARLDIEERKLARKGKWNKRRFAAKRKRLIVFAEVFDKSEERSFELISQAQALGALCFKKDIVDIGLKRKGLKDYAEQKLYFIGEDEDENVEQALTMIEDCCKNKEFNTSRTQFYIFATTVESEALIDSIDKGKMIVRRVNENRNLVYATLREPAVIPEKEDDFIFKHAVKEGDVYKLRVLIVGLGNYGMELLKALCWSCQITKHEIEVYVFDKEGDAADRIARVAPDLIKNNGRRETGYPYYKIIFGGEEVLPHGGVQDKGVDVRTRSFFDRLESLVTGPITAAFITLGEDELNIETAMGLRAYFGHKAQQDGQSEEYKKLPKIYPVVYSAAKNRICSKNGGLEGYDHKSYDITFIGNMEERYAIEAIEQTELEEKGKSVHLRYLGASEYASVTNFIEKVENWEKSVRDIEREKTKSAAERKEEIFEKAKEILKEVSQALAKKIAEYDAELKKNCEKLQEQEVSWELLKRGLTEVEIALEYDHSNATLKEKKSIYEACLKLQEKINKYSAIQQEADGYYDSTAEKNVDNLKAFIFARKEDAIFHARRLKVHIDAEEWEYYRYEYLRNSSIATALHEDIRDCVERLYIAKVCENSNLDEEDVKDMWLLDKPRCEHTRWMAYMWSEGYRYGKVKSSVAKTHSRLVSNEEASANDVAKTKGIVASVSIEGRDNNVRAKTK